MKMTTRAEPAARTRLSKLRRRLMLSSLVPVSVCASLGHAALAQTVATAGAASASNGQSAQLQEVVVTAQKRGENLQTVPIVVEAFSAKTLSDRGIQSAEDLTTVTPGLVFGNVIGYAQPHLRGVGTTSSGAGIENPVAMYIDGVYVASMMGSIFQFNNVDSVEVDKGPQGTLFGRNATGGAIEIKTKDPSSIFGGSGTVGYGNYDTTFGSAYVTGPISAGVTADLAALVNNQGEGYGKNFYNNEALDKTTDIALRSKVLITDLPKTKITIAFDYEQSRGAPDLGPAPGYKPEGSPIYTGPAHSAYGIYQPYSFEEQGGASATVQYDLDFAKLLSITAYRQSQVRQQFDGTLTDNPAATFFINGPEPHGQVSEELQLQSPTSTTFTWVAGLYYFHERSGDGDTTHYGGGAISPLTAISVSPDQTVDSGSAFGQATWYFMPKTSFTAGVRYTVESRSIVASEQLFIGPAEIYNVSGAQSKTFSDPSWKFALQHEFSDNIMGYLTESRGFKSGGFNNTVFPIESFKPETLDDVEGGIKSEYFDHKVRVNAGGFYYNYTNIQAVSYPGGTEVITNGAKAELYGLDLDVQAALNSDFTVSLGLEAIHDRYIDFPDAPISEQLAAGGVTYVVGSAAGNRLSYTPSLTTTLSLDYKHTYEFGKIAGDFTYSYDSGFYGEADDHVYQHAYNLFNASMNWKSNSGLYGVKLWGKNLTNVNYVTSLASQGEGDYVQWAPPRTYGFDVTRYF
jgi:iron complex outermembrane receptor protein